MQVERAAHRVVSNKSTEDVVDEWDRIADVRHKQVSAGNDLSFTHVLEPTIRSLLVDCNLDRVLDVGCGVGHLTRKLASISRRIVAVDPSPKSIDLAKTNCKGHSNVDFFVATAESFARDWSSCRFTTVAANMTLMACLDLDAFVQSVSHLVQPEGHLVASITHPWFWPHYAGYANAEWFTYTENNVVEAPFHISQDATDFVTTHVHRPLESYFTSLSSSNFVVDQICEPIPSDKVQVLYPDRWRFPRFLLLRALRTAS